MLVDTAVVMVTVPDSLVVEVGSRSCRSRLLGTDTEMAGVEDDAVEERDSPGHPEWILGMDDTLEEEQRAVLDWGRDNCCQDESFSPEPRYFEMFVMNM